MICLTLTTIFRFNQRLSESRIVIDKAPHDWGALFFSYGYIHLLRNVRQRPVRPLKSEAVGLALGILTGPLPESFVG